MPFTHDDLTKEVCEFRYTVKGETPEEIQQGTSVAASTVRRWAKLYGWDEMRAMRKTSGRSIAARLRKSIEAVLDACDKENRLPTDGERDGIRKTWLTVKDMDKEADFASTGLMVIDELSTYIADHHPAMLDSMAAVLAEFARDLVARVS